MSPMEKTEFPQQVMSPEEYFKLDHVNQTLLKEVLRSPAHAEAYLRREKAPTASMMLGTAVHAAVLNPDNFENEVAIQPDINRRTKEGKAQYEAFLKQSTGKVIINRDQSVDCIQIGAALARSDTAQRLLRVPSGMYENSFFWEDKKTGLKCKARIDAHSPDNKSIVDLKTTQDASPSGFARSVAKFGYHIQASFYLRAASGYQTGIEALNDGWKFNIVAVETKTPYAVACYTLDQRAIIEGDKKVDEAMGVWAECKLLNDFRGYPDELTTLSLPNWALTEPEDQGLLGV